nr:immunoglobulin heavy chain junction region [Mus musculus]NSM08816.1 immunoglobulin heavy chain junction region [Mus musculus]
CARGLLLGDYW